MQGQNQHVDFNTYVEVNNLKDTVWRLSARVFLLEDFIRTQFGEVLGPAGFTNMNSHETTTSDTNVIMNVSVPNHSEDCNSEEGSRQPTTILRKRAILSHNTRNRCKYAEEDQPKIKIAKCTSQKNDEGRNVLRNEEATMPFLDDPIMPKEEVSSDFEFDDFDHNDNNYDSVENSESDNDNRNNQHEQKDSDFEPGKQLNDIGNDSNEDKYELGEDGTRRKSNGIPWDFIKTFKDETIARQSLGAENWKVVSVKKLKEGRKIFFRCGPPSSKCPAKVHIHVKQEDDCNTDDLVDMFVSNDEHFHNEDSAKLRGLGEAAKIRINEMLQLRQKPKRIMATLRKEGFQMTMGKLNNYIQRRRQSIIGSRKSRSRFTNENSKLIPTKEAIPAAPVTMSSEAVPASVDAKNVSIVQKQKREDENQEVIRSSTSKIRGPGIIWEPIQKFGNMQEAKEYLAEGYHWRQDSRKKVDGGIRIYYRCDKSCPAKVVLFAAYEETEISMLTNNKDHSNHGNEKVIQRVTKEMKARVLEMYKNEIRGKEILEILEKANETSPNTHIPSRIQINNLIAEFKKQGILPKSRTKHKSMAPTEKLTKNEYVQMGCNAQHTNNVSVSNDQFLHNLDAPHTNYKYFHL